MAKKQDEQPQQTMEDFLLAQLQEEVILKDGTQLKAAIKREQCQTCLSIAEREQARPKGKAADGHVMTKQEAIATNLINLAMNRRSSESRAKRIAA